MIDYIILFYYCAELNVEDCEVRLIEFLLRPKIHLLFSNLTHKCQRLKSLCVSDSEYLQLK